MRILLVEDDVDTLDGLTRRLGTKIPSAEVVAARNVRDATAIMKLHHELGKHFQVIILDFRLPVQSGGNPEVDESLCDLAMKLMPEALVAHITSATKDDPKVAEHVRRVHLERADRNIVISKNQPSVDKPLIQQILGYPVRLLLDAVFPPEGTVTSLERSIPNRQPSATHQLGKLMHLIKTYWHDLDSDLQDQIGLHFVIEPEGETVTVSMGGPSAPTR